MHHNSNYRAIVQVVDGKIDSIYSMDDIPMRYNKKLDLGKLVTACRNNKRFQNLLADTLNYALNHFEEVRGEGSSEVLFFESLMEDENIDIWETTNEE
jgi:hypothetical protein